MSHDMPERDPRSRSENEGLAELDDGAPQQQWAVDPQEARVPGDEPVATEAYGLTAEEQAAGEPLEGRLNREEPQQQPGYAAEREAGTEAGAGEAGASEAAEAEVPLTADSGLGVGSGLDTELEPGPGAGPEWPAQPEEPSGQVWDEPRPAGRLVAPDEGARPDAEPDEVAQEAGPDRGGYSAEEQAMRVEPEEGSAAGPDDSGRE